MKIFLILFSLIIFFSVAFLSFPKNTQAAVGCVFSPSTVQAGQQIGIITSDLPGVRTVYIQTYGDPRISVGTVNGGSGLGTGGGSVTIPSTANAPAYQVLVDSGFGAPITCADPNGVIGGNLSVTLAPGGGGCDSADVNNNGTIDLQDVQLIGNAIGQPYNPNFDLNGDSQVTQADADIALDCEAGNTPGTGTVECNNFVSCVKDGITNQSDRESSTFIGGLITDILPLTIAFGGFIAIIMIVISGIQFVTSSGDPNAAGQARGRLTFALIGFALLALAYMITRLIDNVFLRNSGIFG